MFPVAQEIQQSVYYGYSNGETLFDESIIGTLEALHPIMDYFPRHLIVGKKINLKVNVSYTCSADWYPNEVGFIDAMGYDVCRTCSLLNYALSSSSKTGLGVALNSSSQLEPN